VGKSFMTLNYEEYYVEKY